jgi:hypothetical protein
MDEFNLMSRNESATVYSKFEESLKAPMKPIIEAHNDLQFTYNSLDQLIDEVVSQNEWLLNSKN